MARLRLPERVSTGRREMPLLPAAGAGPAPAARDLLFRTWAGRVFLASSVVKLLVAIIRQLTTAPPAVVEFISAAATLGLIVAVFYFLWKLVGLAKGRLLWRVRRKLIISYIFIGVIPALLIVGFFLLSAGVVSMTVSAYLFRDGYDAIVESVGIIAQAAATDIARDSSNAADILKRTEQVARVRYPNMNVSLAFVPAPKAKGLPQRAGPWEHESPPGAIPTWARIDGFQGTVTRSDQGEASEAELVVRAVKLSRGPSGEGWVVVDLLIDDHALDFIYERTSVKGHSAWITTDGRSTGQTISVAAPESATDRWALFRASVAFFDCAQWRESPRRITCGVGMALTYNTRELWTRLTAAQSARVKGLPLATIFLFVLGIVALLFLLIQGVALIMGLTLARSITSSIHELFMGTERVQQGDFAHRIRVTTDDQLGELAKSFNQMTGSIEGLLQTAAEKKRLDEELRIARQIQMSLLPRGPLDVPGLGITALCVPAREVGGDYYDFFHLPNDRIGVLIADVAGKGTSAALYMAELKGVVLALSQSCESPRQMLIEVNRIISDNLDSRSFITMTYAVIDRRAATMTYCRAGHTPLVFLPGPASPDHGLAQILTPDGIVVGLQIPGAAEKFAELLEEKRIPLHVGDVIVLFTDGITEAMNTANDLFGETRLSRIVEEHGHLASGELRERILREIEAFVGQADQHDDMTMILMKVEQALVTT